MDENLIRNLLLLLSTTTTTVRLSLSYIPVSATLAILLLGVATLVNSLFFSRTINQTQHNYNQTFG